MLSESLTECHEAIGALQNQWVVGRVLTRHVGLALHSHSTDETTSHSTRLSKNDNQVAGYMPPNNGGQVAG